MLDLIALTKPGPFQHHTLRMGRYFGLRRKGKLIAMAGQRLHLSGFCEISAICTHPDYRKQGYAGYLTSMLSELICQAGETPFLHVAPGNDNAMRLYRQLGFRKNQEISLTILRRTA